MTPSSGQRLHARRRPAAGRSQRAHRHGQALVEFALVFPIFLVLLLAIIEFSLALNALLSITYATRDAALIAAEGGSTAGVDGSGRDVGADCLILRAVGQDVTAPADGSMITEIRIYRSSISGTQLGSVANVYQRGGSTQCTYASGTVSVPYVLAGSVGYPGSDRCDVVAGCPNDLSGFAHPGLDTIGVQITYQYQWHTPLANLIGTGGNGYTLLRANATRMEPVL